MVAVFFVAAVAVALETVAATTSPPNLFNWLDDVDRTAADVTRFLSLALLEGDVVLASLLLADPRADLQEISGTALHDAAAHGDLEVLHLLFEHGVDPALHGNRALRAAAEHGQAEVVEMLLETGAVDPGANNGEALLWATVPNSADVMAALLRDPRVDPTAYENLPVRFAAGNCFTDLLLQLLRLPAVDPTAHSNAAYRDAYAAMLQARDYQDASWEADCALALQHLLGSGRFVDEIIVEIEEEVREERVRMIMEPPGPTVLRPSGLPRMPRSPSDWD